MNAHTPIIDAHHHIWRLDRTPWLNGPVVPRIFGDYASIRRDYDVSEFGQEARACGVVKSVYVQVNVAPGDEVWEVEWAAAQGVCANLIQAVIGYADLAGDGLGDLLDRQMAVAPLRGIRQQLHWHENPIYRFAASPALMLAPAWQKGLRELARRNLHFELQIFPKQYHDALTLIDVHPDMRFVLLHAGMPEDQSAEGRKFWIEGLKRFAQRPNVVVKLSALSTFSRRLIADDWRAITRQTVDIFTPKRCMFGSNFPVEKLWTDYASLISVMHECLRVYSHRERQAIWHDNAAQFYQI